MVLCGSSLFGLRAADGVVDWCEAQGIGLDLIAGRFPIVGAAVVLDIRGPNMRRIDREAGWAACEAATADEPVNGSVGVGTGCTVGKEAGVEWSSKGGQGSAVRRSGDVTVGAIVAVNALGSVLGEDGRIIAGCRAPADHIRYPHAPMSVLRSQWTARRRRRVGQRFQHRHRLRGDQRARCTASTSPLSALGKLAVRRRRCRRNGRSGAVRAS